MESSSHKISGFLASRIANSRKRKRVVIPKNRQNCPHCNQLLTIKTFRRHQKLFKRKDGTWLKESDEDESCVSSGNGMSIGKLLT